MFVRAEDFEALSGQTVRYDRKPTASTMNLCAHCHGWLWNNNPAPPGIKVTRAGSLDVDWAELIGNIWTDSKPAWGKIGPELVNFPKQAMDRTSLLDACTRHRLQPAGPAHAVLEKNSSPEAAPKRRSANARIPHRAMRSSG
jgi:hypothetical protein